MIGGSPPANKEPCGLEGKNWMHISLHLHASTNIKCWLKWRSDVVRGRAADPEQQRTLEKSCGLGRKEQSRGCRAIGREDAGG